VRAKPFLPGFEEMAGAEIISPEIPRPGTPKTTLS